MIEYWDSLKIRISIKLFSTCWSKGQEIAEFFTRDFRFQFSINFQDLRKTRKVSQLEHNRKSWKLSGHACYDLHSIGKFESDAIHQSGSLRIRLWFSIQAIWGGLNESDAGTPKRKCFLDKALFWALRLLEESRDSCVLLEALPNRWKLKFNCVQFVRSSSSRNVFIRKYASLSKAFRIHLESI